MTSLPQVDTDGCRTLTLYGCVYVEILGTCAAYSRKICMILRSWGSQSSRGPLTDQRVYKYKPLPAEQKQLWNKQLHIFNIRIAATFPGCELCHYVCYALINQRTAYLSCYKDAALFAKYITLSAIL